MVNRTGSKDVPSLSRLDPFDRRRFLLAVGGGAAAVAFAVQQPAHAGPPSPGPKKLDYPFTLGVASGDPLPDSVVLWTRLAPQPLAPAGGMTALRPVPVAWQVATDQRFSRVVRSGVAQATPEYAFSVHVDVRGLRAGTDYWYRFSCGGHVSEPARTRTAPAPGAMTPLRFAFASCMNYRAGYFQTMTDMAAQDLDVVFFLGDYIYEYPVLQLAQGRQLPTDLPGEVVPETTTLEQYRLRYALYKSQPELIQAHQVAPWAAMWDDHEVYNDYEATTEEQLLRQAAAYRAYWEHMPLRRPQLPRGPEARLYRRLGYGGLAQFDMLDARQYRSPELTPATIPDSPARRDPARSMLGGEQERWFARGLATSRARWNLVPQGVLMALVNTVNTTEPRPATYSAGNWDGYQASQKRVFDAVAGARRSGALRNFVVLTGDVHCGYVSELPSNLDDPTSEPLGTEFTSLSITSAQDFNPQANEARQIRTAVNPQMKWADLHCGYVTAELTSQRLLLDYRAVDRVSRPDDPVYSLRRFVVEDGSSRVHVA
ncbi:alkaline phosphatase D family protein [Micromonospora sp. WMMD812]|uniref:alkaline phosphatase D family protein n=1 Tax=Micromonospora sp. WMMD812 TaxID=3015152 RepID=UPI00248CF672|nr:alkaline phosphatase D family protein [Micromonospora sp. WMMD812]WBB69441.1 alkaline phosphatase D family protein [Micromonospora sp. WMMD812]